MALFVFGTISTSEEAKLNMVLDKTDGSGRKLICGAHVNLAAVHGASSCSTLLDLNVGDQLFTVGQGHGVIFTDPLPLSSFQAYLLYRDDTLP